LRAGCFGGGDDVESASLDALSDSPLGLHQPTRPSFTAQQVVKEERSDGGIKLTVTVPGGLVQKRFTEIVDIMRRWVHAAGWVVLDGWVVWLK